MAANKNSITDSTRGACGFCRKVRTPSAACRSSLSLSLFLSLSLSLFRSASKIADAIAAAGSRCRTTKCRLDTRRIHRLRIFTSSLSLPARHFISRCFSQLVIAPPKFIIKRFIVFPSKQQFKFCCTKSFILQLRLIFELRL